MIFYDENHIPVAYSFPGLLSYLHKHAPRKIAAACEIYHAGGSFETLGFITERIEKI